MYYVYPDICTYVQSGFDFAQPPANYSLEGGGGNAAVPHSLLLPRLKTKLRSLSEVEGIGIQNIILVRAIN